jgi:tetratricopeptide (TPR) repeat protein
VRGTATAGHVERQALSTSRSQEREYRPLGFATEAIAERAERFRREGRHFAAALEWQALVQLDPADCHAALRWAAQALLAGQRARATEAYLVAASIYAGKGETTRAMVLARQAIAIDPAEVTRGRIARVVHACGREGEALCEDAARAHVAAGRFDRATALRELLVECDPGSVTKTLRAAELALDHGDASKAEAQLAEAASRMHATGRTGEYVRIAETMIAHGRHDPDTTLELARIYLRRGQPTEALAKLELLRRNAPGRLEVVELLVRCYASLGDTAAAIVVLEETLRRRGHDPVLLRELLDRCASFGSRDPGFTRAIATLRARPQPVRGAPPPPPRWATGRTARADAITEELPRADDDPIAALLEP